MFNRLFVIAAMLLLALGGASSAMAATAQDQVSERGIDRPGMDFKNFEIPPPAPQTFGNEESRCRESCQADAACRAWTIVKPGVQGAQARCWHKNGIPRPVSNGCCTSGVVVKPVEQVTDRPGGDYKNFDLDAADFNACRSACQSDQTCRGWTYVKPGVQGAKARCWLKNVLPAAFQNDCCVSGEPDRFVPPH